MEETYTGGVYEPPGAFCYQHPGRVTRITCRRCEQPICGECMVAAPVGFQCRRCVKTHTRTSRQNIGQYGGQISTNPRSTSLALIGTNVAVWAAIFITGFTALSDRLVNFLGLSPIGICRLNNTDMGWGDISRTACREIAGTTWLPGVSDGAWWQVLTSLVTHQEIAHVGFNCLTLWFLGPALESLLGRARFLTTYFVSGLVGSLAILWLSPVYSTSIGGSGSLFGLMGALLVMLWRRRANVRQLLMWLGINLLITFIVPNISWQAHLGGLLGGILLACIWTFIPPSTNRSRNQIIAVSTLVLLVASGIIARAMLLA